MRGWDHVARLGEQAERAFDSGNLMAYLSLQGQADTLADTLANDPISPDADSGLILDPSPFLFPRRR